MKIQLQARKAERSQKKAKIALNGPSGSGKTYTALALATGLRRDGRVLLADTERGSASLYADDFDFDTLDVASYTADYYCAVIQYAVEHGYDVLVIDSLSHAWEELLEEADRQTARDPRHNSFQAWAKVTPLYKRLVQAVVSAPIHIIATTRAKSEYVIDQVERNGRTVSQPRKVGLAPIFRQGGEYEFDVVANVDLEHNLLVEKTRFAFLADKVVAKADEDLGRAIRDWLASGRPPEPVAPNAPIPSALDEPVFDDLAEDAPDADPPQRIAEGLDPSSLYCGFGPESVKGRPLTALPPGWAARYLKKFGAKEAPEWREAAARYVTQITTNGGAHE